MTDNTPTIEDNVYAHLKNWLLKPAETRILSYTKTNIAANNSVRQILFDREGKAVLKYGAGLDLSNKLPPFRKAAEKLADAVFFLYQAFHLGDGKVTEHFVLVQQLHTLLSSLLGAYKSKAVPPFSAAPVAPSGKPADSVPVSVSNPNPERH